MFLKYLAVFAASYVIGSLSLSIIVSGGLFGKDIRSFGSGNAGATNMARVFGWSAGVLTLVGDAAKAVLCMVLGNLWLGDMGLAIAAFGCILGHCYPIAFGIDWRVGLAVVGAFLLGALLSKKVSVGSICGALAVTIASIAFGVSTPKLVLAILCMVLAIYRHKANIQRLIDGTEPDFKAGKSHKIVKSKEN